MSRERSGPRSRSSLQDVPAERAVLAQERAAARVDRPVVAPHERLEQRQVLARVEERVPLDELALLPQEPVELGGVERAETAPEDEVLRRRDGRDRVELEEAEPAHGLENVRRRAVEALRPHRDSARRLDVDRHAGGGGRPARQHHGECSCDAICREWGSLPNVARRKRNPWVSASEVLIWLLFALLLIPVGFAGYAVGHYTSIGKPPTTVTVTVAGPNQTNTTTTSAMTTTTPATTTSAVAGAVAAGKAVFASAGCGSCHTFTPAGSSGTVGPNLDTAPAMDAKAAGQPLPAFIKESIVDPAGVHRQGLQRRDHAGELRHDSDVDADQQSRRVHPLRHAAVTALPKLGDQPRRTGCR